MLGHRLLRNSGRSREPIKLKSHDMKPIEIEQQFAHRGCEVCASKQTKLLHAQRFASMSEGSLVGGYNVVACDNCGFCYADHLPGQDTFDRYYRDMSKYEQPIGEFRPSAYDVERFRVTVEKIHGFMPDGKARIVEIGCATGLLLSQLKQAGYTGVAGLDPSPACSRVANEQFRVPVQCGALSDDLITAGSVDLLILIGVMEHIRDLEVAMKKMVTMLAPGGRMFITVPDASKYAAGDDAPYQEFSLEHINYFGPKSLANLMARYGFRCLFTEQAMQRCNVRTVTPVVHAAFEKLPAGQKLEWVKDNNTVRGLELYVAQSKRGNDAVQPILNKLAVSKQPVIVWGAGSHTLRLLATSRLAEANLTAIVDSNPRYQGKNVNGVPILEPDAIRGTDASILISSRVFQQSIQRQIKDGLQLENDVVTLYQLD
jgi:2-polyprenyl-3-methyl-5-hydroxy-6-metoxy-1,4-benzoquinol methylase